ncbi:Mrc2 [Symbiodinium sp. CCMP2456]|nr:Mrc2 [Symbiodinium sp. CCMP2456]
MSALEERAEADGYVCPEGWTESEGSCFRYVSDHGTFAESNLLCKELHSSATLATIGSVGQNLAAAKLVTGSGDAWIGKRLYGNEEYWMDGSCSTYSPGLEVPLTATDACGRIFAEEHQVFPKWGRWNCDLTRAVMCGFSVSSSQNEEFIRPSSNCPEGWTESEGSCFRYVSDPVTTAEGDLLCKELHSSATLATIGSAGQNLAAAKLIAGTENAFIGRRLYEDGEYWMDGSCSTYSPRYEAPLQLNEATCGRIFHDEHQFFPQWGRWPCDGTRPVMCGFSMSSSQNGECSRQAPTSSSSESVSWFSFICVLSVWCNMHR